MKRLSFCFPICSKNLQMMHFPISIPAAFIINNTTNIDSAINYSSSRWNTMSLFPAHAKESVSMHFPPPPLPAGLFDKPELESQHHAIQTTSHCDIHHRDPYWKRVNHMDQIPANIPNVVPFPIQTLSNSSMPTMYELPS